MKLQAAEFQITHVASPAPEVFHVTASGPTTHTFYVFASTGNPVVISTEVLALAEIGDQGRHALTELLKSIYYLNKQEIHARANEAR